MNTAWVALAGAAWAVKHAFQSNFQECSYAKMRMLHCAKMGD